MRQRIFLVDDNVDQMNILREKLTHDGYEVATAASAEEALSKVSGFDPALIITDLRMPGMSGIDLMERVLQDLDGVDVIVATAHEDMNSAVEAMKAGAFDYIVKPFDLAQVEGLVSRCLKAQKMARVSAAQPPLPDANPDGVVGSDPRMIEIYKMIGVLARNRATVLIRGETGTGKEMIAQAIHDYSSFGAEPFIAVNCTSLSDNLLESELFGHVKGSFTGAVSSRRGYFELAGSGTIFLDEIGDTSPDFQTKLLRVLQERQFYPVGGEEARTTGARVIAATHQPIERLVEEGGFREDLYFRLKVMEIHVPALRERSTDIPLLVSALMQRIQERMNIKPKQLAPGVMERLRQHPWPGNVRELENVLTRASVLARGAAISDEHIILGVHRMKDTDVPEAAGDTLDSVIQAHVLRILERTGGNKSQAARTLSISRSRLARILDRTDSDDDDD